MKIKSRFRSVLVVCTLFFVLYLNISDVSKLSIIAETFMGKSKNKPMSIATLFVANGSNKKKSSNKIGLSDKGKGSIMETHSKAIHDMPPLP